MRVGTRGDAARIIRTAHFGASIFALDGFNSLKKKKRQKKDKLAMMEIVVVGRFTINWTASQKDRQEPTVSVSKLKKKPNQPK